MSNLLTRVAYREMATPELQRRLRQVGALQARSMHDALADAFTEQEISAVLAERGVL